jgi:AmmeMemoRadiSam system protein B/AmmeMemoRadiSam system protein A
MQELLNRSSVIIGLVTVLICLFALTYPAGSASIPSEVLSPVVGDLEVVSSLEQCSGTKWCFNQYKSGGHAPGGGICQADDTYAWDANLNTPNFDSDVGKPVYAVEQGVVAQTYGDCINAGGSYGQLLIEHDFQGNTWWSGYLHLRDIQVTTGQSVDENTLLGYISNTSLESIPNHLHLVVYKGENSRGKLVSFDANIVTRNFSPKFNSGDYVQTTADLHLRTNPEIDDNIITTIPSSNTGQVVDDENNGIFADGYCWWHVQFGSDNGWCAEDWLEKIKLPIRQPSVSGIFYPSDPSELRDMVDKILESAKKVEVEGRILALVVPHDKMIYSGSVAAESFKQLEGREEIKTVVIVGPSHYIAFGGISVYPEGYFKTPLGLVEIDSTLAREIINMDAMIRYYSPAHEREHAIEVELPFIQRINEKAKIVPMVVGSQSSKAIQVLESIFTHILSREDTILVMSVDLSYYHPYEQAVKLDKAGLVAIEKLDAREFLEKVNSDETEVDNPAGIMAMLMAAESLGGHASLLKYANSGDVTGDKSAVVGYGAVMVTLPPKEEIKLDDASRKELLKIARLSIEEYLKSGNIPKLKPQHSELLKKSGAFVILEKAGNLRGCIGYTQAIMPLYETVTRAAIAAATQDTRFKPVSKEELKQLEISISVLSPLRRIENVNEIEVGKHGLVIRKGGHSGLLLPQVATEEGWDRITFLRHTCLKAGLPFDAWMDKETEIYVFTADTFSEKEFPPLIWDINSDGIIDILDLVVVGQHFGESPPKESRADVNKDGKVDILDLISVGRHFGE